MDSETHLKLMAKARDDLLARGYDGVCFFLSDDTEPRDAFSRGYREGMHDLIELCDRYAESRERRREVVDLSKRLRDLDTDSFAEVMRRVYGSH